MSLEEDTQRQEHRRTQRVDGSQEAKERSFRRNQTSLSLDLRHPAPLTMRK